MEGTESYTSPRNTPSMRSFKRFAQNSTRLRTRHQSAQEDRSMALTLKLARKSHGSRMSRRCLEMYLPVHEADKGTLSIHLANATSIARHSLASMVCLRKTPPQ